MRSLSTAVLSLVAMALSSMTTYLTFFDARYTLTQAVASVQLQVQSGGGSSNGEKSAYYRYYPYPQIILSNRGTRPLVLSNVELVKSSTLETCTEDESVEIPQARTFEAIIVEPGTVQQLPLELALPAVSQEVAEDEEFDLQPDTALWCLKWTAFDPNGERQEPLTPVFTTEITFTPPEPGDRYPSTNVELDFPKGPTKLITRGWF